MIALSHYLLYSAKGIGAGEGLLLPAPRAEDDKYLASSHERIHQILSTFSKTLNSMGSYISIHNNTTDTYLVKVGHDEAALQIASITGAVVASVAAVIAAGGAAAPLTAALVANGVVEVFGVTTASLAAMTSLAASMSAISIPATAVGWGLSMTKFFAKKLEDDGYVQILPGQTKQFGKYSLSLWRQGTCLRVRQNPQNQAEVVMETVYMRPIFTGATDGSTLVHDIQYWIGRFGHENRHIVRMSPASRAAIDFGAAQKMQDMEYNNVNWVKAAEEAGISTKEEALKPTGPERPPVVCA